MLLCLTMTLLTATAEPTFCDDIPSPSKSCRSLGRPSHGTLEGARALVPDDALRVLPERHARRCLKWSTARMVEALQDAGRSVQAAAPGSPALAMGDLSRANGGSLAPYSHSHQSGRDADLSFYMTDVKGEPVAPGDLLAFDAHGVSRDGSLRFDSRRTWQLVKALLADPRIEVQWLFISRPLRVLLLEQARKEKESPVLRQRAEQVLHQPSDAPAHDDHLHLRIRCTADERRGGCRD